MTVTPLRAGHAGRDYQIRAAGVNEGAALFLDRRPRTAIVHHQVNNLATGHRLDEAFSALSHPARRTIVERLAEGPGTIGEVSRGLGLSKPAVTKHVHLLEQAGLVNRTIEGRTHRLELRAEELGEASRWLERHRGLWERKFAAIEAHLGRSGDARQ